MTFLEIIELSDEREPNQFDTAQKLRWLKALQQRIEREAGYVLEGEADCHGAAGLAMTGFGKDFETELCIHYLTAQIAAANGETERYNRAITLFNDMYAAWLSALIRSRHGVKTVFSI